MQKSPARCAGDFSLPKMSFRQATGLFEPLKRLKKSFDPTRKGTLTVPFHTFPPSELFGIQLYRLSLIPGAVRRGFFICF